MKTDSLKLKEENIAGYNAAMTSPAMQKIMADTFAREAAIKAAQYNWKVKTPEEVAEEIAAEQRYQETRQWYLERQGY